MATVIKPRPIHRPRPGSLAWLARQVLLIPEMVLLPLIFALYILTQPTLTLAVIGEAVIALFLLRTGLLWSAGRAWSAGRYRRAGRYARLALRLYPWSADGVALLAEIRLAEGKVEEAEALYRRAITLFPGYAPFHVGVSRALSAERQWPEARKAAMEAVAVDDECAQAYAQLAYLALNTYESTHTVTQWIEIGLAESPSLPIQASLYTTRAEVAVKLEQTRMAEVALEQAVMAVLECPTPAQAELLYRLGHVRRRLGQNVEAREDFERIGQLDPEGRWVNAAWRAKLETALSA